MRIAGSVALVTGGGRGFGLAMAEELQTHGAKKVYVGVRNPADVDHPGVEAVALDVTDTGSVAAAAQRCDDVTLLVNNAGTGALHVEGTADPDMIKSMQRVFDVNLYGTIRAAQAFAPVMLRNGGGAIVNVVSDQAWYARPILGAYAVSKSAVWNFTNALRVDLRPKGVQVLSLHVGFMDTDLVRDLDVPKNDPHQVAAATLDALEHGDEELLADDQSKLVKGTLSTDQGYYLDPPALG
ncbi:Short-chain dehydrogenase [Asanoa hainanensis]|uniref:Short-chain dehydrogenase n=1 Tax=Asanoa hainanensis TaxID=560556 RepID=A0A239N4T7_9ACTN|nr:SDR family oxidoreductase [Asanoa hainanensis]SNT49946.1 Short-chain dehydrogenase [Asanoa hainanensis]